MVVVTSGSFSGCDEVYVAKKKDNQRRREGEEQNTHTHDIHRERGRGGERGKNIYYKNDKTNKHIT